jgi:hypothetical protein
VSEMDVVSEMETESAPELAWVSDADSDSEMD